MVQKSERKKQILFWHRRDLRIRDNAGLYQSLKMCSVESGSKYNVQPIFIFDKNILKLLNNDDKRMPFLLETVQKLKSDYKKHGSDLWIFFDEPLNVFEILLKKNSVAAVVTNTDYEPYARQRDDRVHNLLKKYKVEWQSFKDQVIFEKSEVMTDAHKPYTVYTPYKKKWLTQVDSFMLKSYPSEKYISYLQKSKHDTSGFAEFSPSLKQLGFDPVTVVKYPGTKLSAEMLKVYDKKRDFPALKDATSHLGLHLRFGTWSIRELARIGKKFSEVWLSELIWRDFFMQILWHFPHVEKESFRPDYEKIEWRADAKDFKRWATGQTGYPLVDAGIRELLATGYMHNRVRMVVASFLTKHLLQHWHKGERFFAEHLLDYDLAANNGNWQWAAGTGCDAAPYFRVFNPQTQIEKFDPEYKYIKKWVPEFGTSDYVEPMVEHKFARERAIATYAKALKK